MRGRRIQNTCIMFLNGITVVLIACFVYVNGKDPDDTHQHYLRAFEDLPVLFDHIIGMLQEKPEVLEKNDVTTFLEFAAADNVDISPREIGFNVAKREANFEDVNNEINTSQDYDWYLLKADDDFGGFVGSFPGGSLHLTADEVAEHMLMAEKKLEEYHNDTN